MLEIPLGFYGIARFIISIPVKASQPDPKWIIQCRLERCSQNEQRLSIPRFWTLCFQKGRWILQYPRRL